MKELGCTKIFITVGYKSMMLSFFLRKNSLVETIELKKKGNSFFLSNLISAGQTGKIVVITSDNLMSMDVKKFRNSYNKMKHSFVVCIPGTMALEGDFLQISNKQVIEICRGPIKGTDYLLSGLQVINLDDLTLDLFDSTTDFHKVWDYLIKQRKLSHIYLASVSWIAIDRPKDLFSLISSKYLESLDKD